MTTTPATASTCAPASTQGKPLVVLAAIGSEMRHDDGVGAAVVAAACRRGGGLRVTDGVMAVFCPEPLGLLGAWDEADLAIVVDAVRSGGKPGDVVFRWLAESGDLAEATGAARSSSHGLGVADVWQISRLTGTAPRRTAIVGIEGRDFSLGRGLSEQVSLAVPAAVALIKAAVDSLSTA